MRDTGFVGRCLSYVTVGLWAWLTGWIHPAHSEEFFRVTRVFNGKSFQLQGGTVVRLASIQVPNVEETRGCMRPGEPFGEDARNMLTRLVQGQEVRIVSEGKTPLIDRRGRRVGQVYDREGNWIQKEMLKAGMAMVYSFPDNRKYVKEMLGYESEARQMRRGMWTSDYFRIITALEAQNHIGRFKLVEGVVQAIGSSKTHHYLNFGPDWKTDFTIVIPKKRRQFKEEFLNSLVGKKIRVRGWIDSYNGPSIEINHPEAIEILK